MVKYITVLAFAGTIGVAQNMTMGLNSATATPGNTASLNLQLNAPAGSSPAAIEWTVNAPTPDVQSITATLGPAASAASKSIYCSGKTCLIAGMNASAIGNGTVAVLTVQLSGTAQGNLAVQLSNTFAASPLAAALPVTSVDGLVSVNPPVVSISLSPTSITLAKTQTQQFSTSITGTTNNAVTWSMSPQIGQLSASGLYTAPSTISSNSTITITATSNADPTKSAAATVKLQPDAPLAISGQVTLSGVGLSGVTVALSGSQSGSASSNASGAVSLTGLAPAGNYTVTPSLSGYTFTPPSQTFNNLSANQTVNFIATAVKTTANNLALGKSATQSSTLYPTAGASNVVDGNTDGNFFHGSISHTNIEANPWWQVDLGTSATIGSIAVWNRTDCCSDRLSDYWVFISNTPFAPTDTPATLQNRAGTWNSHQTTFPNPSSTIPVNAQGRYVRVQLSGTNYLHIAEVQVFGSASSSTYTISGQVMFSGAGLSGVSVALSGSQSGSASIGSPTNGAASSNASGTFSFAGLAPAGSYTVTPSLGGYTFTPPSQTFNNLSANQTANFIATAGTTNTNLALGKSAAQSSTLYPIAGASNVVDGNTDGNFFHGSISHTNIEANPWWQVDLGTSATIGSIAVWNRTDCCSDRLSDYWVFISNTPFAPTDTPATLQNRAGTWNSHQTTFPNPSSTIPVNAQGRYVRVQLSGTNYLHMAEVQVFGSASSSTDSISGQVSLSGAGLSGVTLALSGSQSGSVSSDASGTFSLTGLAPAGSYTVTPSLSGYTFTPPSQTFNNLSANQTANFIATAGTTNTNLALGKSAAQSSTLYPIAGASNVVDGNTDGNFFHGSISHTNIEANPWWQVDLGTSATIGSIAVWNRTDCCSDRLSDYWVFISNTPFAPTDTPATLQNRAGTWNSHQTTFPNPSSTIPVNAQGRYVRVQLSGTNYLHMAEVQVFGH